MAAATNKNASNQTTDSRAQQGQQAQTENKPQGSRDKGNPYSVTQDKFWNFIPGTDAKAPELLLYGPISSQQSWWEDRVTPQQFNKELAALGEDVPEIVVRINSGGGDVFAANAIFTRLKDHKAKVTVKIDGWAASAATIIAMAGDSIKIARNGVFMIHDPAMTVWDTFKAEDFLKMADDLGLDLVEISAKTGRKAEEIEQLMANETWWTGDTAVENGFCDEIMFEESSTVIENASRIVVNSTPIDLSFFQTVPKQLLNSPHNPGSLINSATATKPEQIQTKEDKSMAAVENTIETVDALKAAYPDLCATIQNEAAAAERNRIKAIEDMAGGAYADIVSDAKFENPITAEQTAVKIIAEQRKQGGQYISDRNADAAASGAKDVAGAASENGAEGANPFDAAIDALKFE